MYKNRQPAAMAAILNKKMFLRWDFGPGCPGGIQVTFPKISAFYIFSRLNPNAPGLLQQKYILPFGQTISS